VWRRDGREIVFAHEGQIWAIPVTGSGPGLQTGAPAPLFAIGPMGGVRDVTALALSRDGQRFYVSQAIEQPDTDVLHVRMGWVRP
jgi:hypothetical protein